MTTIQKLQEKICELLRNHKMLTLATGQQIEKPGSKLIVSTTLHYKNEQYKLSTFCHLSAKGNSWEESIVKLFRTLNSQIQSAIDAVENNELVYNCEYKTYTDNTLYFVMISTLNCRGVEIKTEQFANTYEDAFVLSKNKLLEELKRMEIDFSLDERHNAIT